MSSELIQYTDEFGIQRHETIFRRAGCRTSEVSMETILRDQLYVLAEALGLKQHRVHRGRGFYDYMFFGLDDDTNDLSRALCRMGLQHTKRPLGSQQVITVKFIWTPEKRL